MDSLNYSKILASILIPTLTILLVSKFVNTIYKNFSSARDLVIQSVEVKSAPLMMTGTTSQTFNVTSSNIALQTKDEQLTELKIKELIETASIERGRKLIKKCISCHSFEENGPNKVGPNLSNVFGRNKGSAPGYKYSSAMLNKGGIWDEYSLFKFLANPKQEIKGTKMIFEGLKKNQELLDLIAFLKQKNKTD